MNAASNHIEEYLPKASLELKRMQDLHEQHHGAPDQPHRHAYYTVLLVEKAAGSHEIDFKAYELGNKQVFFISPGQVHRLIPQGMPTGWALTFSREFMARNNIQTCFIDDVSLFKDYGEAPPLLVDEATFKELASFLSAIEKLLTQQSTFKYEALGAWLKLFLITCHRANEHQSTTLHPQNTQVANTIIKDFKALVEQHFKEEHQVHFYAEALAVTADHLNKTLKILIGKSPKEYIQNRIITEVKRLLIHADLNVKAIAYQLGFKEPSHLSKFFKNCTGQSISTFKTQITH